MTKENDLIRRGDAIGAVSKPWIDTAAAISAIPTVSGEPVLYAVKDWEAIANHPSTQGGTICTINKTDLHDVPLYTTPQNTITIDVAEYEMLKKDAERWRRLACNQTALMLGSTLDPNDSAIDWYSACNFLADKLIDKTRSE